MDPQSIYTFTEYMWEDKGWGEQDTHALPHYYPLALALGFEVHLAGKCPSEQSHKGVVVVIFP